MLGQIFGHSEDFHEVGTSDIEHYFTEPLVAVPIYLALLLGVFLIATRLFKFRRSTLSLVFLGIFFTAGVGLYSLIPAISFGSLISGIVLAFVFAFSAIIGD